MTVDMMPDAIRAIQGGSVDEGYLLRLVNGTLTAEDKLPDGMTEIRYYAFYKCTSLALTTLPEGLTSIGSSAFSYCTSLEKLTFKGTPTTIKSNAFNGCTNLTTINVPWAEGAVANAPWGATNAVINYNYTNYTGE